LQRGQGGVMLFAEFAESGTFDEQPDKDALRGNEADDLGDRHLFRGHVLLDNH